jgi:hypothetical protein
MMIPNQHTLNLSPYIAIYDIVVPKDNMLRQIKDSLIFPLFKMNYKINIVSIMVAM